MERGGGGAQTLSKQVLRDHGPAGASQSVFELRRPTRIRGVRLSAES